MRRLLAALGVAALGVLPAGALAMLAAARAPGSPVVGWLIGG
ncbi:hypothetical protein [Belnapia arida]|nr:hypothetical protein [Belnapia arida]